MWVGIAVIIGLLVGVFLLAYVIYRGWNSATTWLTMLPQFLVVIWAAVFAVCLGGVIVIPSDGMDAYLENWVGALIVGPGFFITAVSTISYLIIVPWFVMWERHKKKGKDKDRQTLTENETSQTELT